MKRLDQHSAFPVVAWLIIIGFAFFTYDLTQRVEKLEASEQTLRTESAINNLDDYFNE